MADSQASTARITVIDIGGHARALSVLRASDFVLVLVCGALAIFLVGTIVHGQYGSSLVPTLVSIAIFSFAAYTGWRHVGVIDPRVWRAYLSAFSLLFALVIISGTITIAGYGSGQTLSTGQDADNLAPAMLLVELWIAALIVLGFICVQVLRRMCIAPISITLVELLRRLAQHGGETGTELKGVKRVNPRRGAAFGAAGAIVLAGFLLLPLPTDPDVGELMSQLSWPVYLLGFFLLVRARRYFQVTADSLLAVDRRAPVLFLRSFNDDEKQRYVSSRRALLDFSLETRLANHFSRFGPFIAVGSPSESVPQLGAAKVLLPDDQWQDRILTWMNDADLIIMYSGKTQSVNWELGKIIASGRAARLILLIPEIKGSLSSERAQEIAARVEQIRAAFRSTPWNEELMQWDDFDALRAMVFCADGSMIMVKSKSRSRDAYHLAALVAHYLLLNPVVIPPIAASAANQPSTAGRVG